MPPCCITGWTGFSMAVDARSQENGGTRVADSRSDPERVAVIGSNSFSGSHFVDACLREGASVVGISRSPQPADVFLPYRWQERGGAFEFRQLDLNHDLDRIDAVLQAFSPESVVNFAAQSMVAQSWDHPEHWYQTNVVANVRLHDRLRRLEGLKKYVHISTPEVYGSCSGTVTDEQPFHPSTPYATSRAACDMHLMNFHSNYGFPVVFTRAANVFGPGQQLYRIVPRTVLYALTGRKLQLHGGGRSMRSFIHIRDVAEGTLRVMRSASPPHAYHLATDRYVAIRELVQAICDLLEVRFDDFVEIAEDRPGKDQAYFLDCARTKEELGWSPVVSLEDGLAETIDWVKENLDELKKQPQDYVHKP